MAGRVKAFACFTSGLSTSSKPADSISCGARQHRHQNGRTEINRHASMAVRLCQHFAGVLDARSVVRSEQVHAEEAVAQRSI
eukprot:6174200-Pleurochrysis_carterae.AAC.1